MSEFDRVCYVLVSGDREIDRGTRAELRARFERDNAEPLSEAVAADRVALISSGVWDLVAASDIVANGPRFEGDAERLSAAIRAGVAPARWGRR